MALRRRGWRCQDRRTAVDLTFRSFDKVLDAAVETVFGDDVGRFLIPLGAGAIIFQKIAHYFVKNRRRPGYS